MEYYLKICGKKYIPIKVYYNEQKAQKFLDDNKSYSVFKRDYFGRIYLKHDLAIERNKVNKVSSVWEF
jgi:hypothetical protein